MFLLQVLLPFVAQEPEAFKRGLANVPRFEKCLLARSHTPKIQTFFSLSSGFRHFQIFQAPLRTFDCTQSFYEANEGRSPPPGGTGCHFVHVPRRLAGVRPIQRTGDNIRTNKDGSFEGNRNAD